eukprot:3695272-Alexandrium_andersonii.AAC.1
MASSKILHLDLVELVSKLGMRSLLEQMVVWDAQATSTATLALAPPTSVGALISYPSRHASSSLVPVGAHQPEEWQLVLD